MEKIYRTAIEAAIAILDAAKTSAETGRRIEL